MEEKVAEALNELTSVQDALMHLAKIMKRSGHFSWGETTKNAVQRIGKIIGDIEEVERGTSMPKNRDFSRSYTK